MRLGVEQELALREVIDLRLASDLHREQAISLTTEGLPQRFRGGGDDLMEVQSLELATPVQ